jgi:hypothetical protein
VHEAQDGHRRCTLVVAQPKMLFQVADGQLHLPDIIPPKDEAFTRYPSACKGVYDRQTGL